VTVQGRGSASRPRQGCLVLHASEQAASPLAKACLLNSCWGARHWSGLDRMCCGPTGVIGNWFWEVLAPARSSEDDACAVAVEREELAP
jgi:hypothetical protein